MHSGNSVNFSGQGDHIGILLIYPITTVHWDHCSAQKTILSPSIITQKSILKIGLKTAKGFPMMPMSSPFTNCLLRTFLFTVIKILGEGQRVNRESTVVSFTFVLRSLLVRLACWLLSTGMVPLKLLKSFSFTNSYYISQLLYSNLSLYLPYNLFFHAPSVHVFKKRVTGWLTSIDIAEAELLITAEYRCN